MMGMSVDTMCRIIIIRVSRRITFSIGLGNRISAGVRISMRAIVRDIRSISVRVSTGLG